ncbi:MAG: hypothetical protein RMK52_04550 [Chitinophagales bacterium]|nr:hypothetical protein [Chitinophagales bacterium]MDW8393496.1 hypothetical protein [Chitinophagales bacterium]
MKKVILGLACIAALSFASCKSGSHKENAADTTALDQMVEEGMSMLDSMKHEAGKMMDTVKATVDTMIKKM